MMVEADFFEKYGPFKKLFTSEKLGDNSLKLPPITMLCNKCGCNQTFTYQYSPSVIAALAEGSVWSIQYNCTACKDFKILFILYSEYSSSVVMKIAQWPFWLPEIDRELQKSLGKNLGNYKKGLHCEQEGYGIGAFAYYRRIIEDMIDGLLDDIFQMFSEEEKEKYIENIKRAKNEHVTEKKIDIVKKILPSNFISEGINPLDILYSNLSEGLHSNRDEECLGIAAKVRFSLEYLLHELVLKKQRKKDYVSAMKELEKQTTSKRNSK